MLANGRVRQETKLPTRARQFAGANQPRKPPHPGRQHERIFAKYYGLYVQENSQPTPYSPLRKSVQSAPDCCGLAEIRTSQSIARLLAADAAWKRSFHQPAGRRVQWAFSPLRKALHCRIARDRRVDRLLRATEQLGQNPIEFFLWAVFEHVGADNHVEFSWR